MSAQTIESISEFLLHAGTNFRIVDMGRELTTLDAQTFLDIENGSSPVPRPRQQHGWFGIIFWNTQQPQTEYIWFVKLPVDEQGLLVTASRNHFLQIIVDALGSSLADSSEEQQKLPDNPYNFVPNQQQMSLFNAYARQLLNKPLSQGTSDVLHYLQHPTVTDWTKLSVQAIADVALQINDREKSDAVQAYFSLYAEDFQVALLSGCEPVTLDTALVTVLGTHLNKTATMTRRDQAILRALTCQEENGSIVTLLSQILQNDTVLDVDTLSVIAARHYMQLDESLLNLFFTCVAQCDEQHNFEGALFKGFFSDLVQIPRCRDEVLALLRTPNRSEVLSRAIGQLFSQAKG